MSPCRRRSRPPTAGTIRVGCRPGARSCPPAWSRVRHRSSRHAGRCHCAPSDVGVWTPRVLLDRVTLNELLGDRLERYAAGFDRSELILALLPRLLLKSLQDGAQRASYVDSPAAVADGVPADVIGIDPWPVDRHPDPDRIRSMSVTATPPAWPLMRRWLALV